MKAGQTGSEKREGYIYGIDGLRAVAVLMVFAYHLRLPFAKGGLLGVTVFFVISGFLITRILITELENTHTINLKNFWLRRMRRLLPAVLTMLPVLIFVTAIFNRVLFTKACSDLLSVLLGYNNWWQIFNNVSYFENAGAPSPLTHCWSLAIEAQFYLLYPLLLIFLSKLRNKKKKMMIVTILLAFVSVILMGVLFDPANDPSRAYYGTDTRVFSLLFGSFLAFVTQDGRLERKVAGLIRESVGVLSFAGLLCMMAAIDGYSSFLYRGGQALASLLALFVILAVLNKRSVLGRVLSILPLKWIGERSYGIYLWHYPIILLLSGGKKASWWIGLIAILLTFLAAGFSYRFIETPIRHGVIRKNLDIIRREPRTRRERKRQIRFLRRGLKITAFVLIVGVSSILCVALVPRKSVLSNKEELEAQADQAKAKQTDSEGGESKSRKEMTDEELLADLDLLLMGDSIALGASDEFYAAFPNSICDAAVSRYTTESFDLYDSYVNEKGWAGDGVIFALGSNGLLYDSLGTMREKLGPDMPFFVFTARAPYTTWETSNNEEIYEFTDSTDNTYLIDWYGVSEGHAEYFDADETHLTEEGAKAYVECIKEEVLKVYKEE